MGMLRLIFGSRNYSFDIKPCVVIFGKCFECVGFGIFLCNAVNASANLCAVNRTAVAEHRIGSYDKHAVKRRLGFGNTDDRGKYLICIAVGNVGKEFFALLFRNGNALYVIGALCAEIKGKSFCAELVGSCNYKANLAV